MIESPEPGPLTNTSIPESFRAERFYAAIQSAALASILSIFWCGVASRSSSHSFWTVPNLMAGVFYGQNSLRPDFGFHTLTGLSIHLLLSTAFALLFASVVPPTLRPMTAVLLGILASSSWFYLLDGFFWRNAFPPVSLYSRRPSIFFSFVLMGICIGLYSLFVRSRKEPQISA